MNFDELLLVNKVKKKGIWVLNQTNYDVHVHVHVGYMYMYLIIAAAPIKSSYVTASL